MSDVPIQVIVAAFNDEKSADAALQDLKQATKEGLIGIQNAAILRRDEQGKLHIKETADMKGGKGAVVGGVIKQERRARLLTSRVLVDRSCAALASRSGRAAPVATPSHGNSCCIWRASHPREFRAITPGLPIPAAQYEAIIETCRTLDAQPRADALVRLMLKA